MLEKDPSHFKQLQKCNYEIKNHILIKIDDKGNQQIMLPISLTKTVINAAHNNPLAAHMSSNKTYALVRKNFWWNKMKKDISNYVKSCDTCLRKNKIDAKHIAPIQKVDKIISPFYKVAIDIIGPMIETRTTKSKYALVIIDLATRWAEVIPIREITAERICNALLSVFTRFGFPHIILSDNGTQFTSQMTQAFTKLLDITQIFAARYHPQSNGVVERLNQTLKLMLAKVTIDKPKDWDIYLPMVLFAYRNSIHQTTNFTPSEMLFGRNPKGPLDIFADIMMDNKEKTLSPYQIVQNTQESIKYALELAKENIEKTSDQMLELKNKNRHLRTLNIDDLALILLPTGKGNDMEWRGPFKVIAKQTNVSYKLLVNGSEKVFHINRLRKYTEESDTNDIEIINTENDFDKHYLNLHISLSEQNDKKTEINLDHIDSENVKSEIKALLNKYADVISNKPGSTDCIQHTIKLTDNTTFKSKTYVVPQMLKSKVELEINSLLNDGLIVPSQSQYSSPMVIVKKKNNSIRICCDYRKLNKVTELDQEGLPNIEDIINTMGKGKIFTTIDLTRGFWQIPMEEQSRKFTAFTTHMGFYKSTVMPFGLVNSTATFTKMMRKILKPHPNIQHYVDDICVFTDNWNEHIKTLEYIFQILKNYNLTVSPEKIKIGFSEIEFLGIKFTKDGLKPTDNFEHKLLNIKTPTTKKHVRALLGLFNYYSKFIHNYSQIVRPLIELTKKNQPQKVKWNEICEKSLQTLKQYFSQKPILTTIHENDNVILATDASKIALGACLMKEFETEDGKTIYKPAYYLSRSLTDAEKKYSVIELECLAIFFAVKKFQRFLLGRHFTILVDHKPLLTFNINNVKNNRINKYAMFLTDYQFEIKSIKERDNHIPDILSRLSKDIVD